MRLLESSLDIPLPARLKRGKWFVAETFKKNANQSPEFWRRLFSQGEVVF